MKLQFKHQQFQTDACNAVCDVFSGQPKLDPFSYIMDTGRQSADLITTDAFANPQIALSKDNILRNINAQQIMWAIEPSKELAGIDKGEGLNLSVEMETGTGKTYTYTKTIYELNLRYGWTKFIIVVPSVAIREGVYKSLQVTAEHFQQEYGKKIRYFIYNSSRLNDIEQFATNSNINVMIINMQAFNSRGKDANRIYMALDTFKGRVPMQVIAATNPIIILDEPQSIAGAATKESLKNFNPLFTLRYSATHRDPYNMVYRLDALDAYNKKLVKKIAVRGVSVIGNTATNGYVYLSKINLFVGKNPTATIEIDTKTATEIKKRTITVNEGDNLYDLSKELDEYKDRYVVTEINGLEDKIRFENGLELSVGAAIGDVNEEQLRRIQIRETIKTHLQREEELFDKNIKVLSLFFIDEVAKYRTDAKSEPGIYAKMFEEEYELLKNARLQELDLNPEYKKFLEKTSASTSHQGYFSIDKRSGKFTDSKIKRGETASDDVDAYDLIMKDKERLLYRKEPVRFIFSHSALREGWDNPNVFQICTLKQSTNDVSRRQEIGRGMRLCVNQDGERMDESVLGENSVHKINLLTVVASDTYEKFVAGLQEEYKDALKSRPTVVSKELFENRTITDESGNKRKITEAEAIRINNHMVRNDYIDDNGNLTDVYNNAHQNGTLVMPEGFPSNEIINIIDSIYKPIDITNANKTPVKLQLNKVNFDKKEFQELWAKINKKSAYTVDFDSEELKKNSIRSLNDKLHVTPLVVEITRGSVEKVKREGFETGQVKKERTSLDIAEISLPYDLIGKIVAGTSLTRKCVAEILAGIRPDVFEQFKKNPEDFITKTINIINDEKATAIVEHIQYNTINEEFSSDIFTKPDLKGVADKSMETPNHHIYNYLVADSNIEREFAKELEAQEDVCVYAKLPSGFYITTPVGKYNPDWAIAFKEGTVKHIYFVAETKGSLSDMSLKPMEKAKIKCAHKHFLAISPNETVKYDVITSYQDLINIVAKK